MTYKAEDAHRVTMVNTRNGPATFYDVWIDVGAALSFVRGATTDLCDATGGVMDGTVELALVARLEHARETLEAALGSARQLATARRGR